jgi:mono/diheme cytochrome c family protein
MKKVVLILFFLGSVGIVYAGGSHKGGHQHKEDNAHWLAPQDAIDQVNPIPADNESVELGRKLYVELCSRCHGESALGNGPDASSLSTQPTDLKAMSGGHTDGDFAWKIRTGKNDMPAWEEDLEVDEIWHLVNFIQSLSKSAKAIPQPSDKNTKHTDHAH